MMTSFCSLESSIHFEELMATAAADARGTTCASSNGNKGIVSSSSSNFPLASARSNLPPSNVAPSNNLTYLTNMKANAHCACIEATLPLSESRTRAV